MAEGWELHNFGEYNKQSLSHMLYSLSIGIIIIKKQGDIIYFNEKALSILDNRRKLTSITELPSLIQDLWFSMKAGEHINGVISCDGRNIAYYMDKGKVAPFYGSMSLIELNNRDSFIYQSQLVHNLSNEIESLVDLSFDELFITDNEGRVLWISSSCEDNYGLSPEQMIGQNVKSLEECKIFYPSATLIALKTHERVTILQDTLRGGKSIVTANPIFNNNGELTRVVSNSRRVSELKKVSQQLREMIEQINQYNIRSENGLSYYIKPNIVCKSKNMKSVMSLVRKVASVDVTVHLEGESGTGKSMLAKAIHEISHRNRGPFIEIDFSTIPKTLIESELFGYVSGAFTGAIKGGKKGIVESAEGGTLFLDEIGNLTLDIQAKLLYLLQERCIKRIGSNKQIYADIRIITATNKSLTKMVEEGTFRSDLYYRLNVVPIYIAPLRERLEDLSVLVDYFTLLLNEKYCLNKSLSLEALDSMFSYEWPGNVRELENILERMWVTVEEDIVQVFQFPECIRNVSSKKNERPTRTGMTLKKAIEDTEKKIIESNWETYHNTYLMADHLGVSQATIVRKLQKYKIRR